MPLTRVDLFRLLSSYFLVTMNIKTRIVREMLRASYRVEIFKELIDTSTLFYLLLFL